MRISVLALTLPMVGVVLQAQQPKVVSLELIQRLREAERSKWQDLADATGIPYTAAHRALDEQAWQAVQMEAQYGYPAKTLLLEWYVQLRQTREGWLSAYLGASTEDGLRARLSPEAYDKFADWEEWMKTARSAFATLR